MADQMCLQIALFTVPPIPSTTPFPWDVAKKKKKIHLIEMSWSSCKFEEEALLKLGSRPIWFYTWDFARRLWKIHCIKMKMLCFVSSESTTMVALLIQAWVVKIVAWAWCQWAGCTTFYAAIIAKGVGRYSVVYSVHGIHCVSQDYLLDLAIHGLPLVVLQDHWAALWGNCAFSCLWSGDLHNEGWKLGT